MWFVYVLFSPSLERHYVGSSTDPDRRLRQHNNLIKGGARCTRAGRPWELAQVFGTYANRSEAFKAERELKKTRRGYRRRTWMPEDSEWCRILPDDLNPMSKLSEAVEGRSGHETDALQVMQEREAAGSNT
jgi:predicted GIY-YIG superfamily endonuclease